MISTALSSAAVWAISSKMFPILTANLTSTEELELVMIFTSSANFCFAAATSSALPTTFKSTIDASIVSASLEACSMATLDTSEKSTGTNKLFKLILHVIFGATKVNNNTKQTFQVAIRRI